MTDEIICAFSGLRPKESEYIESDDELEDLPEGWSKITIQTRKENPEWKILQAVKMAMTLQLEAQIGESATIEETDIAKISIRMQVEAQFSSLEDRIPRFNIEERTTFISDPNQDNAIQEMFNKFLSDLDLIDEPET